MARILCIDDDRDILDTCEVILQGQGHEVQTAVNGKEGFGKAMQARPDLIILDVVMDEATEGFHTACRFRREPSLKYVPIMMLSAVNETAPQKFSDKDGEYLPVDAFVDKPIRPKEFVARVKALLALKPDQVNVEGREE